jgi:hypothetical protein
MYTFQTFLLHYTHTHTHTHTYIHTHTRTQQTTSLSVVPVVGCKAGDVISIPAIATSSVGNQFVYGWMQPDEATYTQLTSTLSYTCPVASSIVRVQAWDGYVTTNNLRINSLPAATYIIVDSSATTLAASVITLSPVAPIVNTEVTLTVPYAAPSNAKTVSVIWDDGTWTIRRGADITSSTTALTVKHTYTTAKTYSAIISIIDLADSVTTATKSITVAATAVSACADMFASCYCLVYIIDRLHIRALILALALCAVLYNHYQNTSMTTACRNTSNNSSHDTC